MDSQVELEKESKQAAISRADDQDFGVTARGAL